MKIISIDVVPSGYYRVVFDSPFRLNEGIASSEWIMSPERFLDFLNITWRIKQ